MRWQTSGMDLSPLAAVIETESTPLVRTDFTDDFERLDGSASKPKRSFADVAKSAPLSAPSSSSLVQLAREFPDLPPERIAAMHLELSIPNQRSDPKFLRIDISSDEAVAWWCLHH